MRPVSSWMIADGRHPAIDEVLRRGRRLGEAIVGLLPSGDDDQRCGALLEQRDGVVEARGQLRRRLAVVLRRTEHDEGVDRLRSGSLVAAAGAVHLHERDRVIGDGGQQQQRDGPAHDLPPAPPADPRPRRPHR